MLDLLIRRAFKAAVLPAGITSRRHRGDVVILLYHRIGDTRSEIELPREAFGRHLERLAATRTATPLDEALARSEGGVVVTFDDGTVDFHERALPVIVQHRVPTLLYLATGGVSDQGLTWSHIADALSTGLVAIGSHTHSHADLASASYDVALDEMRRSKELIEDQLGVPCRHFAYPWGVASPDADRAARELFATAALDGWRTNRRDHIDPYRLGRVPVLRSDGQLFFRAKAAGRLDAERVVYRALGRGPWRRTDHASPAAQP